MDANQVLCTASTSHTGDTRVNNSCVDNFVYSITVSKKLSYRQHDALGIKRRTANTFSKLLDEMLDLEICN